MYPAWRRERIHAIVTSPYAAASRRSRRQYVEPPPSGQGSSRTVRAPSRWATSSRTCRTASGSSPSLDRPLRRRTRARLPVTRPGGAPGSARPASRTPSGPSRRPQARAAPGRRRCARHGGAARTAPPPGRRAVTRRASALCSAPPSNRRRRRRRSGVGRASAGTPPGAGFADRRGSGDGSASNSGVSQIALVTRSGRPARFRGESGRPRPPGENAEAASTFVLGSPHGKQQPSDTKRTPNAQCPVQLT